MTGAGSCAHRPIDSGWPASFALGLMPRGPPVQLLVTIRGWAYGRC
jgi:hypothetical protein